MCRMGSMLLAKLEVENYGKFGKTCVVQLFNRKRPHHILPYMASIKETSPSRRVAQMACCHFDSLERRSWKKRAQPLGIQGYHPSPCPWWKEWGHHSVCTLLVQTNARVHAQKADTHTHTLRQWILVHIQTVAETTCTKKTMWMNYIGYRDITLCVYIFILYI